MPVYNIAKGLNGTNWATDDIQAMLMRETFVFDRGMDTLNFVLPFEVSVAGYTRQPLLNRTVNINDVKNRSEHLADDITFITNAAGQNAAGILIFKYTGDDFSSIPLVWLPFSAPEPTGPSKSISGTFLNGRIVFGFEER